MKALSYVFAILFSLILMVPSAYAAKGSEAKILSVNLKNDHDSTGRKIKSMTVVTQQTKVPMWGTLVIAVLVKDKDGTEYFGTSSFPQRQRSGNDYKSLDKWQFNIVMEGLTNADVSAYSVQYLNNENGKVMDTKNKNVKPPDAIKVNAPNVAKVNAPNDVKVKATNTKTVFTTEEWINSYEHTTPLTIISFAHQVIHQ